MSRRIVELSRDMKDDYNYNESIKTLRTNILFCGSKVRTIMFTSSVPDEGKSDITSQRPSPWPSLEKGCWSLMQISAVPYWSAVISWGRE